ncbi:MAG: hypothetical protein NVSMB14_10650 [Isosphaeraceae bacterium]
MDAENLSRITLLRRALSEVKPVEAMESLVQQLSKTASNEEFLKKIAAFQKTGK